MKTRPRVDAAPIVLVNGEGGGVAHGPPILGSATENYHCIKQHYTLCPLCAEKKKKEANISSKSEWHASIINKRESELPRKTVHAVADSAMGGPGDRPPPFPPY